MSLQRGQNVGEVLFKAEVRGLLQKAAEVGHWYWRRSWAPFNADDATVPCFLLSLPEECDPTDSGCDGRSDLSESTLAGAWISISAAIVMAALLGLVRTGGVFVSKGTA